MENKHQWKTSTTRRGSFHSLKSSFLLLSLFLLSCETEEFKPVPDDWCVTSPEAAGLNGVVLDSLSDKIQAGDYGEIHSLVIVRHGNIAFERYYRGYSRDATHPVYSITKSVTSLLVGVAFDEGKIHSVDSSLLSFFPSATSIANMDANKRAITLEHVLTMTTGFQWDEATYPYGDPRNDAMKLAASPDWTGYMLDLPVVTKPGTAFRYNSGCTILLSGVLRNATGMSATTYAESRLFQPLGITRYSWETGPHNITNTGWGLHLRARDMAKIGLLVLRNGRMNDAQIVSRYWLSQSTVARVQRTREFSYGYQWWMLPLHRENHTPSPNDILIAWGWGDQFIFIIPALDLVVATTAGNYAGSYEDEALEFLQTYILRSVK